MNTENTTDTANQQANSGGGSGETTDAANQNGQTATVPDATGGQGDGGAGSNAGEKGASEGGTADGKTGDGQKPADDQAVELTGAPEAYSDFSLPEGFALDGERKELALSLFRDSNLSQAGAQKHIDAFIKLVADDAAVQQQAQEAAIAQQRDNWAMQAKAELGDKYDAQVQLATTAVQALNNPKLVQAFDEQGWGNHPELLKVFATLGTYMRDSSIDGIGTGGSAAQPKSLIDRMYPAKN